VRRKIHATQQELFLGHQGGEQALQDVEKVHEKYKHMPHAPNHLWPIQNWGMGGIPEFEPGKGGEYKEKLDTTHMKKWTQRQIIKLGR
jgi:hypothetical protein